nr:hypothetical protein [Tanacetum cinerariifolium]
MADIAFTPQHNMVAYLEKTKGNAEFHQIVDFFTLSSIHHALTIYATLDGKTVSQNHQNSHSIFASMLAQSAVVEDEGRGDSLVRAATTASLDAHQDSSNIAKTQSKATLNELNPLGEGSGSGPGCQETMGGAMAQIRPEVGSGEDMMEHVIEVTDHVPQTPHDSPLSGDKDADKTEEFNLDDDTEVIVEDNGSGEKGEVSTAEPKTPPAITTLFDDKDITIADTLVKMKSQKAKEKGVAFKDADD